MKIGRKKIYENSAEISLIYKQYSINDERSGDALKGSGLYNESAYLYIQSMEKYVKYAITQKINPNNPFMAQIIRDTGHSLEKSLNLMLEVYSNGNVNLKQQIQNQLDTNIFKGLNLNAIQNNLRYPHYDSRYKNYYTLEVSYSECCTIKGMLDSLKKYIDDMNRI